MANDPEPAQSVPPPVRSLHDPAAARSLHDPTAARGLHDPAPVRSLRNLGPATELAFARAGIHSADEIRAIGADAAYLKLLETGSPPHFIGYYVLVMALQDRPWNDCKGEEKRALRARFDALKARGHDKGRSDLEAALNILGVVQGPGKAGR